MLHTSLYSRICVQYIHSFFVRSLHKLCVHRFDDGGDGGGGSGMWDQSTTL